MLFHSLISLWILRISTPSFNVLLLSLYLWTARIFNRITGEAINLESTQILSNGYVGALLAYLICDWRPLIAFIKFVI